MKRTALFLAMLGVLCFGTSAFAGFWQEFQITTNPSLQLFPAIWDDTVVWEDSGDIFSIDLATMTSPQLTDSASGQSTPAIWNDTVVWQDNRNGTFDIYGFNLSTNTEFQITTITPSR